VPLREERTLNTQKAIKWLLILKINQFQARQTDVSQVKIILVRKRGIFVENIVNKLSTYSGADKSLARPGRKQATAAENFDFPISYL